MELGWVGTADLILHLGMNCIAAVLSSRESSHPPPERATEFSSSDCHINTPEVETTCPPLTPVRGSQTWWKELSRRLVTLLRLHQRSPSETWLSIKLSKDAGHSLGSEPESFVFFGVLVSPAG